MQLGVVQCINAYKKIQTPISFRLHLYHWYELFFVPCSCHSDLGTVCSSKTNEKKETNTYTKGRTTTRHTTLTTSSLFVATCTCKQGSKDEDHKSIESAYYKSSLKQNQCYYPTMHCHIVRVSQKITNTCGKTLVAMWMTKMETQLRLLPCDPKSATHWLHSL